MSEFFRQTSDEPYLRHHYKLVYENGKSVVFDNYQDVHEAWFNQPYFASHIEVLDIKKKSKGFK